MPTGASVYPGAIDDLGTIKADSDLVGQELANASAAIENIEAELGTDPAGPDATVKARLDRIDAHVVDTSAAHAATAISYAGGTGMSATDVEAALDELATEKVSKDTSDVYNLTGTTFLRSIARNTWTISNVTPDRDYDCNATTIHILADALGTLIAEFVELKDVVMSLAEDLQDREIIG